MIEFSIKRFAKIMIILTLALVTIGILTGCEPEVDPIPEPEPFNYLAYFKDAWSVDGLIFTEVDFQKAGECIFTVPTYKGDPFDWRGRWSLVDTSGTVKLDGFLFILDNPDHDPSNPWSNPWINYEYEGGIYKTEVVDENEMILTNKETGAVVYLSRITNL
jgi:hypothetical protein